MNNEKDLFIKARLQKDKLMSKKVDDVVNEFLNGEFIMEEKEKKVENNLGRWKKILVTAASLVVVLGVANVYASTQGYGNVFNMIKKVASGEPVDEKKDEEIKNEVKNEVEKSEIVNTNKSSNTITNTTKSEETSKVENLDVNSELVKKLYNCIPAFDGNTFNPPNAYQTNKTTIENMNNEYLLAYAFTQLSLSNSDKLPYQNEDGTTEGPYDGWFCFKADILQEKVKEIYGKNIENADFEYGNARGCNYRNGMYMHSSGGYASETLINIRDIEKAYKSGDEIYIEDRYMALKNNENNETCELFASSDSKETLKKIDYSILEKTFEQISRKIKNKYSDNMVRYKHTFKKNADGSYYWYSTEPVN